MTISETTRWVLAGLYRRYQLDDVEVLVDDADYVVNIFDEDYINSK